MTEEAIYEELKKLFPELWMDEPINGADAVDRLNSWKENLNETLDNANTE